METIVNVATVLVALPNDRTPAALVQAIEAGKGVFTEKPGARSAAEFEPVLAALRRRPVPFTVAYLNRGSAPVQQARELFRAGAIGRLLSVELRMVTTQVGMRNPDSWLFRRQVAGGGILAWLACHWLDALRFVTGEEPGFEMCPGLLETRFYAARGIPAYAYGPGLLTVSHGPNEFVPIRNIAQCAAVYALTAADVLR